MFTASHRSRARRAPRHGATPRRGVALVFVLVFVIAMAALAMSSIFMASNSNLLAKSYDRERDLRYAAEAALSMGKARVNSDPGILVMPVDTIYRRLMFAAPISDADGIALPGVTVNVYAGLTGSSSGQNGRFASIVAEARDKRGNGFIRRLELTQESFAKFAYWSNSESNSSSTIFFNNADELWGPVWSNDVISIGSGGATFHDQVGTAKTISGKSNGTFIKQPLENQKVIALPSTTALNVLPGYATVGNTNFTNGDGPNNDEAKVLDRIEFLAFDIDGLEDSTSDDEGFFRYYQGLAGKEQKVRGDWTGSTSTLPALSTVELCGDWHYMPIGKNAFGVKIPSDTGLKFYPVSVHNTTWFKDQIEDALDERPTKRPAGYTSNSSYASAEKASTLTQILDNPNARCFPAGDPHLVSTDRLSGTARPAPQTGNYLTTDVQKGGEDTTFTAVGRYGSWKAVTQTVYNDTITKRRPWDGRYLNSLSRKYNSNMKGVIYASGNVGVSGVVNGLVTLYAKGNIVILDDIRYANDPVTAVCHDILGMISDFDVVIADNAINTPPPTSTSSNKKYFSLDDTKDMYIHGIAMALGTSFRVEDFDQGPTDVNDCDGVNNGRGCIFLSGGLIQKSRGAVGTSGGTGYSKRYTYDHCAIINPPPYFPTTGRFQDNRYLELDPAGFKPLQYFQSITPSTGP